MHTEEENLPVLVDSLNKLCLVPTVYDSMCCAFARQNALLPPLNQYGRTVLLS